MPSSLHNLCVHYFTNKGTVHYERVQCVTKCWHSMLFPFHAEELPKENMKIEKLLPRILGKNNVLKPLFYKLIGGRKKNETRTAMQCRVWIQVLHRKYFTQIKYFTQLFSCNAYHISNESPTSVQRSQYSEISILPQHSWNIYVQWNTSSQNKTKIGFHNINIRHTVEEQKVNPPSKKVNKIMPKSTNILCTQTLHKTPQIMERKCNIQPIICRNMHV